MVPPATLEESDVELVSLFPSSKVFEGSRSRELPPEPLIHSPRLLMVSDTTRFADELLAVLRSDGVSQPVARLLRRQMSLPARRVFLILWSLTNGFVAADLDRPAGRMPGDRVDLGGSGTA